MPALLTRWKLTVVGMIAYAAVSWCFGSDVTGERKAAAQGKPGAKPASLPITYYGVAACSNNNCHGGRGEPPTPWIIDKDDKEKELLCRCSEAIEWRTKDKHAVAYNVLTSPRGEQMAKILGYDVTKSNSCLSCHAVVIKDAKVLADSKMYQFKIEDGVNCVVCHRAHVEWVGRHGVLAFAPKWRPLSREDKEAIGGMRNLWDPIKRAELCVSCHVGSVKEDKFVTHEMYAADHPPLPGFEIAAFSEQMPRHWQYLREKSLNVRSELGYKEGAQEQTQLILVGAAVALRETMALLEAQAEKCLLAKDDNGKALDLANFDCYACHHDLKTPSWRQKREYPGKPGRVPMRPSSTELVKLGTIETLAKKPELSRSNFNGKMKLLQEAFDARPYGDPIKIKAAASATKEWADCFARQINASQIDAKTARVLLDQFSALYGGTKEKPRTIDYDSARQVAWSFEVIYEELNGKKGGDPKMRETLRELNELLKLRLPQGHAKVVMDELGESMMKVNAYDPDRLRQLLFKLNGLPK